MWEKKREIESGGEERAPGVQLSAEQLEAMGSPLRIELLTTLRMLEKASANELAAQMGMSPKGLYHHLRTLEAAGLVGVVDKRRSGRRWESVYAPTPGIWNASLSDSSPEFLTHLVRSTSAMTRALDREQQAATLALAEQPELAVAMRFRRMVARLTPEQLNRLLELLDTVERFVGERQGADEGHRISLTLAVLPLVNRNSDGENP